MEFLSSLHVLFMQFNKLFSYFIFLDPFQNYEIVQK